MRQFKVITAIVADHGDLPGSFWRDGERWVRDTVPPAATSLRNWGLVRPVQVPDGPMLYEWRLLDLFPLTEAVTMERRDWDAWNEQARRASLGIVGS